MVNSQWRTRLEKNGHVMRSSNGAVVRYHRPVGAPGFAHAVNQGLAPMLFKLAM